MDTSLSMALERLTQDSLLSLREAQGHGVAVFSGCLWITQEGDLRDHIVEAGDTVRFDRAGRVVIQALADTRLLRLDPIAALALHREARRLRSAAIGDLLQRLVAFVRRSWRQA